MNKLIIFTTLLVTGFLTAQVSENREVADFSKLKVSSSAQVYYTVSNTKSVKVETNLQDNLQYIKTEVENGTLKIFTDKSWTKEQLKKMKKRDRRNVNGTYSFDFEVLKIIVSGPNLEEIKASSSSFVKIKNLNKSDNLLIDVSSSGTIMGTFDSNELKVNASSSGQLLANANAKKAIIQVSSAGTVKLEGTAVDLMVNASSSGSCNLKEFKVENANVTATSSASLVVNTSKSIDAKAATSGSISFYGNPATVSKEESSSGSVNKNNY